MRLLDTHTGHFVEFHDTANVRYAILSHTWDACGEQTYQDVREIQKDYPIQAHATSVVLDPSLPETSNQAEPISGFWIDGKLSEKIRKACEIARSHGYRYLWIDSCCIDKTSSSELSEAINSMYAWYGRASICYAFLADVPQDDVPDSDQSAFRKSRWFRRGWTLQELIAPRRLLFLSRNWQTLGSKNSMAILVEQITRIDRKVLTNQLSLDKMSVAQRMSWAAERETTRVEDRAYSLLGIFDLNLPTLYGEGERAFRRLQEEILRRIPDQTLFALSEHPILPVLPTRVDTDSGHHLRRMQTATRSHHYITKTSHTLFSSSPSSFIHRGSVHVTSGYDYHDLLGLSKVPYSDYSPSPYGIRSSFPVIPLQRCFMSDTLSAKDSVEDVSEWHLVFLSCHCSSMLRSLGPHLLARVCRIAPCPSSKVALMTAGSICTVVQSGRNIDDDMRPPKYTIFIVTANQLKFLRQHVQMQSIYLPNEDRASSAPSPSLDLPPLGRRLLLALSSYTSAVLRANGYDVAFYQPSRQARVLRTHALVLQRRGCALQINIDEHREYGHLRLRAAAWFFAPTDAELHHFPLSTSMAPHGSVEYSPSTDGGFPVITLSGDYFEGVAIRLELEKDLEGDTTMSHYLHVDIEELGDR